MRTIVKYLLSITAFCGLLVSFEKKPEFPVIYMIGDSTMADKSTRDHNQERGWGQMLPCLTDSRIKISNHAVNGRSSKSFRNEGRWEPIIEALRPGDYVFIQFGHNDEKSEREDLYADSRTDYRDNLKRYIAETRERGGIPILFTSIARRHFNDNGELIDTHGDYITAVFEVGRETGTPVIDMNSSTTAMILAVPQEDSKKFFMWVGSKEDNTHLNVYGGKVVAKLAADEIARTIPELAPFMPDIHSECYKEVDWFTETVWNKFKN
ncbi:MAG: rhamnogalacturonan acetylesterase [Rikenellaceae bacterium]|nr:rhamnogalacturonan acetylesterase [Rikenellaceae bacterium]